MPCDVYLCIGLLQEKGLHLYMTGIIDEIVIHCTGGTAMVMVQRWHSDDTVMVQWHSPVYMLLEAGLPPRPAMIRSDGTVMIEGVSISMRISEEEKETERMICVNTTGNYLLIRGIYWPKLAEKLNGWVGGSMRQGLGCRDGAVMVQ